MHVITGQIRKDVYTKEGNGNKGRWKMYAVDLSERYKDRDGATQYTNYRATFFASENQIQYYDQWIQKGQVISATAKTLAVNVRDSNGKTYITLEMERPDLAFFEDARSQQGGGQQQHQQQQGQQQQRPQQQNQQANNEPPMDFDNSDIPF